MPKSDKWVVPEGIYRGVLREARVQEKVFNGVSQQFIRVVFMLKSQSPRFNLVVGRNFNIDEAAKFETEMVQWLGDGFYDLLDAEGVVTLSKLEALVGHPAELHVVEIQNDAHKKPFSHLCSIKPVKEVDA